MTQKRRNFIRDRPALFGVSLILTLLAALAFSVHTAPIVGRRKVLAALSSPDPVLRDRALSYIIRRTTPGSDLFNQDVLDAAVEHLRVADDKSFLQLAFALSNAGQWKRPTIPDDAWMRWITTLGAEASPAGRITAAQELGFAPHLLRDAPGAALLDKLAQDDNDDVRYNAIVSAALGLAASPELPALAPILARGLEDENIEVARQSWMFLGLLARAGSGTLAQAATAAANTLRERGPVPPRLFQAILWAQARLKAPFLLPPEQALAQANDSPELAAAMVYALSQSPASDPSAPLAALLRAGPAAVTEQNYTVYWRAILALPLVGDTATAPAGPDPNAALLTPFLSGAPEKPALRALALAAGYRLGVRPDLLSKHGEPWGSMTTLAAVESPRLAIRDLPLAEWVDVPDMLRLMAVRASTTPQPDDLYPTFASTEPTIRDLAAAIAAERFTPAQNAALVRKGLADYNDNAKMTAAILAGLSGQGLAFLDERFHKEDQWIVKQVMGLGLLMGGAMPTMKETAVALLTRSDMPHSTLVLAMIHAGMPQGMDYLFNPRGEPMIDLRDLFDQRRWWPLIRRYLPADAPPFWIWADRNLDQFQVEVIRNWYLLHGREVKKP